MPIYAGIMRRNGLELHPMGSASFIGERMGKPTGPPFIGDSMGSAFRPDLPRIKAAMASEPAFILAPSAIQSAPPAPGTMQITQATSAHMMRIDAGRIKNRGACVRLRAF
jgi:hypothetical protein